MVEKRASERIARACVCVCVGRRRERECPGVTCGCAEERSGGSEREEEERVESEEACGEEH